MNVIDVGGFGEFRYTLRVCLRKHVREHICSLMNIHAICH